MTCYPKLASVLQWEWGDSVQQAIHKQEVIRMDHRCFLLACESPTPTRPATK